MNVLWLSLHQPEIIARGYWDQTLLENLLASVDPTHYEGTFDALPLGDGAVVIVPARWHVDDVDAINEAIFYQPWVFIVLTGDEEGVFPWQELEHDQMKVWVQTPYRSKHEGVDGKFGDWWPPSCVDIVARYDIDKNTNWFYSGQINNPIREDCYHHLLDRALTKRDGVLKATRVFGSGMEYVDYMKSMMMAKIAPCPSGTFSPDTFRLYEALEAGCIPIVDVGANPEEDYWNFIFHSPPPFPILESWDNFDNACDSLLRTNLDEMRELVGDWFRQEKLSLALDFFSDLKEVSNG